MRSPTTTLRHRRTTSERAKRSNILSLAAQCDAQIAVLMRWKANVSGCVRTVRRRHDNLMAITILATLSHGWKVIHDWFPSWRRVCTTATRYSCHCFGRVNPRALCVLLLASSSISCATRFHDLLMPSGASWSSCRLSPLTHSLPFCRSAGAQM